MNEELMTESYDQHSEYRRNHRGGSVYLAVEGVLWLFSATLGALGHIPISMLVLLVGGMFIHPIAILCSKLLRLTTPSRSNQLSILNMWTALIIPLGIPLVFFATSAGKINLFYPAFTVLVGAHWLPFIYIYSMKSFLVLAGILVLVGNLFGFVFAQSFSACGFVTGGILLLFAAINVSIVRRELSVDS